MKSDRKKELMRHQKPSLSNKIVFHQMSGVLQMVKLKRENIRDIYKDSKNKS